MITIRFAGWISGRIVKAASHRIWLRLTIRLMANGSLHTSSIGRIPLNFLGFDRLPAYLKLFQVSRISGVVGFGVLAACGTPLT